MGIEELNDKIPVYIKICRNVGGLNTYRLYQRQIIGKFVRFENADTKHVAIAFGGLKSNTLKDNLETCYRWIYNINHARYENIYVWSETMKDYIKCPHTNPTMAFA